jgi:hypothetical protein
MGIYPSSRRTRAEFDERRLRRAEREAAAGLLIGPAPDLKSLDLKIDEVRPGGGVDDVHYIRRIVVASAPALFEFPCSLSGCEDGGYDLTREILSALSARREEFTGELACQGHGRAGDCHRVLRYAATATYDPGQRRAVDR